MPWSTRGIRYERVREADQYQTDHPYAIRLTDEIYR